MGHYFCAKILQELSEKVIDLALDLGVPKENIVFNTVGCTLDTLGVYIKFSDQVTLSLFKKNIINAAPHCIVEKW